MGLDEPVWDNSSFTTNQDRLIQTDIAAKFLAKVLEQARRGKLLSKDHFSVDGTLIQSWASLKSFKRKDGDQPTILMRPALTRKQGFTAKASTMNLGCRLPPIF